MANDIETIWVQVANPGQTLPNLNKLFHPKERRTQQWFKMVQPPGEARPDLWQTIAVALD